MAEQTDNETLDVLHKFLVRFWDDQETGTAQPLEHYQQLFPGFEEVIAAEYGAVVEGENETTADIHPPQLGQLGSYRLRRELGHGGQGIVYLAEHEDLHRHVALKVLSARLDLSPQALARFRREAEMASRLQHAGICTVYDMGEIDGMAFIAMQYVEGESLARKVTRAREQGLREVALLDDQPKTRGSGSTSTSRGPVLDLVRLLESAARAVHAVHEVGVVHRDLKPANVMVGPDGEPVVLDFGLARDEEAGGSLTRSGDVLGTPAYLAPEQIQGTGRGADARADVYGLGATLYECLTLHRPFEAPTRDSLYRRILEDEPPAPGRFNPELPRDLCIVLETALQKEPDRRYRTALDLAEDLRRVRCHEPIRAKRAGPLLRTWRWTQRNPVVALLLVLLTVALVTTGVFLRSSRISLRRNQALSLVGASEAALASNPRQALQLAYDAVETEVIPETVSQLHAALAEHREEAVLVQHRGPVWHVAVSPRGDRFATASLDKTFRILDRAGRTLATISDLGFGVSTAFSRSGTKIAVAGAGGAVLYDLRENGEVSRIGDPLPGPQGAQMAWGACFSPDEHAVLVPYWDGKARLFRLDGGKTELERAFGDGGEGVLGAALFSPGGDLVLAKPGVRDIGGFFQADSSPRLWHRSSGKLVGKLEFHRDHVTAAAFSPDGARIVTASRDHTACIWEVGEGTVTRKAILEGHADAVMGADFAPDGATIVTGSRDKTARLWTPEGELLRVLEGHQHDVRGARFSWNGARILTWSYDGTARVWDRRGNELYQLRGHRSQIEHAGFMPATSDVPDWVFSASQDGTVRLWSAESRELPVLRVPGAKILRADFLPATPGQPPMIFTASSDGMLRAWTLAGDEVPTARRDTGEHLILAASAGDRIATSGERSTRLWDWNGEQFVEHSRLEPRPERDLDLGLALSPRGDCVFNSGWAGPPRLHRDEAVRIPSVPHGVRSAAFSPRRRELVLVYGAPMAASSRPGSAPAGAILVQYEGRVRRVRDLHPVGLGGCGAFSPDGEIIALGSTTGEIELLRRDGEPLGALHGHKGRIGSLCFSADPQGRYLLSTSRDRTVRLWDFHRRAPIAVYRGHRSSVESAVFSPDGKRVLTASTDGTARTWFVETEDLLDQVRRRLRNRQVR